MGAMGRGTGAGIRAVQLLDLDAASALRERFEARKAQARLDHMNRAGHIGIDCLGDGLDLRACVVPQPPPTIIMSPCPPLDLSGVDALASMASAAEPHIEVRALDAA